MTLENRRDLYSSDPEIYWRSALSTTVVQRTTTTRATVAPRPMLNPEPEDAAPLPDR